MTEPKWRYHTPERDGHAPDDWVEGMEVEARGRHPDSPWGPLSGRPHWLDCSHYRYRPLQDATSPITPEWCLRMAKQEEGDIAAGRLAMDDATVEPSFDTLKDQCLRLPQDQREALIEAMQKPTLLPCPFCGQPVQHRFALHVSDGNTDDIIHAEPTDCGLQFFSIGSADMGKAVQAAWNRRAS